ncbi:hypothetical protein K1719_027871 [Acacia pycnantha]|nr:hypothetical protein K1719_027871 [Acacia pycnantha]
MLLAEDGSSGIYDDTRTEIVGRFREIRIYPIKSRMGLHAPADAYLATLLVSQGEYDLRDEVDEAQKQDDWAKEIREKITRGETQDYDLSLSGLVEYKKRSMYRRVDELRRKIMDEAHKSKYTLHPCMVKMYLSMKSELWWPGMKKDVTEYVAKCLTRRRLTKSAHFIPISIHYSPERLAGIYIKEIVRLHGIPKSIVSDRDTRFKSRFWQALHEGMGTKLRFSSAYHPQTDWSTGKDDSYLEDMPRACAPDFKGSWDQHLSLAEFAYNNSYHASIQMAPFEALYGRKCQSPLCFDDSSEKQLLGRICLNKPPSRSHGIL